MEDRVGRAGPLVAGDDVVRRKGRRRADADDGGDGGVAAGSEGTEGSVLEAGFLGAGHVDGEGIRRAGRVGGVGAGEWREAATQRLATLGWEQDAIVIELLQLVLGADVGVMLAEQRHLAPNIVAIGRQLGGDIAPGDEEAATDIVGMLEAGQQPELASQQGGAIPDGAHK
ncbi:MAG TPA: hypothetical protein DEU95_10425 [Chloroflexi bacterium]|nr:hypothetical protein [Chloroflexota bacterium]